MPDMWCQRVYERSRQIPVVMRGQQEYTLEVERVECRTTQIDC